MTLLDPSPQWLLIIAAIAMLISLVEAWLATLIVYGKVGNSDTLFGRVMVCAGFLPATIGFGYIMVAVLGKLM